jgi:formyl-CoA transferase
VEGSRWDGLKMQNAFPKLSRTPGSVRSPAPEHVGQDNDAVLGGMLELDAEARADLAARGII